MKSSLKYIVLLCFAALYSHSGFGQELQKVPPLDNRVVDLAGLLSEGEKSLLSSQLQALEESKGSQLVVLTIGTTEPETIEQFSIRIVDQWKLGRADVDDGVLLVIAKNDRKVRIEVGYGLEGAIPDIYAKRIISNIIIPHFRDGDYPLGIEEGVEAIISLVEEEELPAVTENRSGSGSQANKALSLLFFLAIIGVFLFVVIAKTLLAKKVGDLKSKVIVIAVVFILVWLIANLFAGVFASFLALVFLNAKSGPGGGRRGGGYYGGYSSGSFGGGFSGGSFGGGFSGGGGSFGGGGASGGW